MKGLDTPVPLFMRQHSWILISKPTGSTSNLKPRCPYPPTCCPFSSCLVMYCLASRLLSLLYLSIPLSCLFHFLYSSIPPICSSSFALSPLFLSQEESILNPLFFSPPTFYPVNPLLFCYFTFSLWLSEDLPAKRCEGGTKCFLLSINNVLYACMALGLPGCGRQRRELSAEIYQLLNLFNSNFIALSLFTLSPSSEMMASKCKNKKRVQWDRTL